MDGAVSAPASLRVAVRRRLGDFELDVAFTCAAEGVTALSGPSGAGKTQVLSAVGGATRPDAGRIAWDGDGPVLFDSDQGVDRPMQARAVGWVFQDARLFPHMDVRANLLYGARRARDRPPIAAFGEVVEVLGVAGLLRRRTRDLSGGERQRVAIGRALLSRPRLLLMDEPLAALDAPRRAEILPYLERLTTRFRLPILYVTHALSEVVRLADRLVVLEAGRVVMEGPVAEVLAKPDLNALSANRPVSSLLETAVAAHEPRRGLTRLQAGGAELVVPRLVRTIGERVRVVVLARDVLLATTRPQGLSARNVTPAWLERLEADADGAVLVHLRLEGGPRLLSSVTRDAVEELGLAPGQQVWAILKSMAVEGARPGGLLDSLRD